MSTSLPSTASAQPTSGSLLLTPSETLDAADLDKYSGGRLIAAAVTFMVLDIIFIGLRFWSRRLRRLPLGWDDYTIYPALAACWLMQIGLILNVKFGGVGRHQEYWIKTGDSQVLVAWRKILYAIEVFYILAVCLSKLAVATIFLRILSINLASRWVLRTVIVFTIATCIGELIALTAQCIPFTFQWNENQPGHCINQPALYRWVSLPGLVTDVVLFALPIPTVWRLHTTTAQKIQISIMFMLGSFGVISSALRFSYFSTIPLATDGTWYCVILGIWTIIEPGMYLISACLPTLRPVVNLSLSKLGHEESKKSLAAPEPFGHKRSNKRRTAIPLDDTVSSFIFPSHFQRLSSTDSMRALGNQGKIKVTQEFTFSDSKDESRQHHPQPQQVAVFEMPDERQEKLEHHV